jgi:serine/threonine-protein kinase HipA
MRELFVYIEMGGQMTFVGKIQGNSYIDAKFSYVDDYLESFNSVPISVSLPLQREVFDSQKTKNFFEGLLPEGFTRRTIAGFLRFEENDYLSILAKLGQECLGAIKIVENDSTENVSSYEELAVEQVQELAKEGVTKSVQLITEAHLSLTGASGKVGLYYDKELDKWYLPKGDAPSTHIVKQSHVRLNKIVLNEQLSLLCAKNIGIDVPQSFIINVGERKDEDILFVSERYDRNFKGAGRRIDNKPCPFRLHQEDFAQAMGIDSLHKYEKGNQKYLMKMFNILRKYSSNPIEDQLKLWDIVIFNYLLGNTDSHIKNFSLLYSANLQRIRLAPAYDLVSTCVYKESTNNMAFNIGGDYNIRSITKDSFIRAANECGFREKIVSERIDTIANRFETALQKASDELTDKGFADAQEMKDKILRSGGFRTI